jgi:hypothetical protein
MNLRYFWKWTSEGSFLKENLLYCSDGYEVELGFWCFLEHFRRLGAIEDPSESQHAQQIRLREEDEMDSD